MVNPKNSWYPNIAPKVVVLGGGRSARADGTRDSGTEANHRTKLLPGKHTIPALQTPSEAHLGRVKADAAAAISAIELGGPVRAPAPTPRTCPAPALAPPSGAPSSCPSRVVKRPFPPVETDLMGPCKERKVTQTDHGQRRDAAAMSSAGAVKAHAHASRQHAPAAPAPPHQPPTGPAGSGISPTGPRGYKRSSALGRAIAAAGGGDSAKPLQRRVPQPPLPSRSLDLARSSALILIEADRRSSESSESDSDSICLRDRIPRCVASRLRGLPSEATAAREPRQPLNPLSSGRDRHTSALNNSRPTGLHPTDRDQHLSLDSPSTSKDDEIPLRKRMLGMFDSDGGARAESGDRDGSTLRARMLLKMMTVIQGGERDGGARTPPLGSSTDEMQPPGTALRSFKTVMRPPCTIPDPASSSPFVTSPKEASAWAGARRPTPSSHPPAAAAPSGASFIGKANLASTTAAAAPTPVVPAVPSLRNDNRGALLLDDNFLFDEMEVAARRVQQQQQHRRGGALRLGLMGMGLGRPGAPPKRQVVLLPGAPNPRQSEWG